MNELSPRTRRRGLAAAGILAILALGGCSGIARSVGAAMPEELVARGVAAPARILEVWDTGWTVNDDPVVGMKVRVSPGDRDAWEATIPKTLVSRIAIPQFQPGAVVPVRFDPQNPALVAVDPAPPAELASADAALAAAAGEPPPILGIITQAGGVEAPGPGVLVERVLPGSPADAAGIRGGDRILAIDGHGAADSLALTALVRSLAGRSVPVSLARSGETLQVTVQLNPQG